MQIVNSPNIQSVVEICIAVSPDGIDPTTGKLISLNPQITIAVDISGNSR